MSRGVVGLKLTINVYASQDPDTALLSLLRSVNEQTGITITTPSGFAFDGDLLDVERVQILREVDA